MKYEDCKIVACPNCDYHLSDDGHDGNAIVKTPDGRIGIWYKAFFEGNWSPTPAGCSKCKKFFSLPTLEEVPFGVRHWVLRSRQDDDDRLRTPTGGYYTSKELGLMEP